jgi:hypothetical protein
LHCLKNSEQWNAKRKKLKIVLLQLSVSQQMLWNAMQTAALCINTGYKNETVQFAKDMLAIFGTEEMKIY